MKCAGISGLITLGIVFCLSFTSCRKTDVPFGQELVANDPDIELLDTLRANLSTLQLDSFTMNNSGIISVGETIDSIFGFYRSVAYVDVAPPVANPLANCNCRFDSVVLRLKPAGGFVADTTQPFSLSVHQLSELPNTDDGSIGFNTSHPKYEPQSLASGSVFIRPNAGEAFQLPFASSFGRELFQLLVRNVDTIQNPDLFRRFIKGLVVQGDAVASAKGLYQLESVNDSSVMRLYYTVNDGIPRSAYIDFPAGSLTNWFSSFSYNRSGTSLSTIPLKQELLVPVSQTGGRAYLHIQGGLYPRFNFPSLLSLKERFPQLRIVKAELEISPDIQAISYTRGLHLPPELLLLATDVNNSFGHPLTNGDPIEPVVQTGNLSFNALYEQRATYTYNITSFIYQQLAEGNFYSSALILAPSPQALFQGEQRLLLHAGVNKQSIKLKLYVLRL